MKALIRRLRADASLQSGANQQTILILADKLERDLRMAVEASQPQMGVDALRELTGTVTRVASEYRRQGQNLPFTWPSNPDDAPKKVPIKTK